MKRNTKDIYTATDVLVLARLFDYAVLTGLYAWVRKNLVKKKEDQR